jgi:fimbrial chaperone protein
MISWNSYRLTAAAQAVAAVFLTILASPAASGQSLSVVPVNIFFSPGQKATSLTVTNQGTSETAVQIRAYDWNQKDGEDQLTASKDVVLSPPLARIAPGATQVVRLILRQTPESREATYRILIDQIPPPAEPGVVHMVLRLSIPIFARPTIRAFPDAQFHLERAAGQLYLVALNAGILHEAIRDIVLTTQDGRKLKPEPGASPYILAGSTRRWRIAPQDSVTLQGDTLQLTAKADAGPIDQQVRLVAAK